MLLSFNAYGTRMHLRNFIRRQKWRFRLLKRFVLPWRNTKARVVRLWRKLPAIEPLARSYRGPSFSGVTEVYPAEKIRPLSALPAPDDSNEDLISEPALLYRFKNIDFWARYGGSVVTSDNKLLADLSPEVWGVSNHPLFSQLLLPKWQRLAGQTAIAVTPEAPGNYYHWLIDLLPRAALLQLGGHDFDRLLVNGTGAIYEMDSLAALKIPPAKIRYVDARDRFQIEQAIIPSMDHFAKAIAPWKIELLRRLRDSVSTGRSAVRKVYISRSRAAVRRILNEMEFEQILRRADFSTVRLEEMSWPEQVGLFSRAEVILAPHGAALANIVFCKPGACVAEIATRAGYKDFYLHLAASARLQYRFVAAQPRNSATTNSLRAVENEDMIIDPAAIEHVLADL